MRKKSVWEHACGLTRTVVEGVDFDETAHAVVVSVRPVARARNRCGRCGRCSPRYDLGEVVVGGGRSIWGRRRYSSRRLRLGCGVGFMG